MLGIKKQKARIYVSAYGKHPAFDDYFSVNMELPLANALSSWVENGVKSCGAERKKKEIHSFRFWVMGIKKDELILGIIRDSSDRMGRTYPLLIIGRIHLKNRARRWPAVFSDFDPVFRAFEEMATTRYETFKEFEDNLSKVRFSGPDPETPDTAFSSGMTAWFNIQKERSSAVLPVSELMGKFASHPGEPLKRRIFKRYPSPPGAVFLGGLPDNPMVNLYNRPLGTRDFHRLFNLPGVDKSDPDKPGLNQTGSDQAGPDQPGGNQNNMDFRTQ